MFPFLFTLYRYLAKNQHKTDEGNPYTIAYRALENLFDILSELDLWGKYVREDGGIEWEDADKVFQAIIGGHKTALCEAHDQSAVEALVSFANTHVDLTGSDYDAIIVGLEALRAQQIEMAKDNGGLAEIEDHPF